MSARPDEAAVINAVMPVRSWTFGSAPRRISASTAAVWPCEAAVISAVVPIASRTSTSAPAEMSASMTSTLP